MKEFDLYTLMTWVLPHAFTRLLRNRQLFVLMVIP